MTVDDAASVAPVPAQLLVSSGLEMPFPNRTNYVNFRIVPDFLVSRHPLSMRDCLLQICSWAFLKVWHPTSSWICSFGWCPIRSVVVRFQCCTTWSAVDGLSWRPAQSSPCLFDPLVTTCQVHVTVTVVENGLNSSASPLQTATIPSFRPTGLRLSARGVCLQHQPYCSSSKTCCPPATSPETLCLCLSNGTTTCSFAMCTRYTRHFSPVISFLLLCSPQTLPVPGLPPPSTLHPSKLLLLWALLLPLSVLLYLSICNVWIASTCLDHESLLTFPLEYTYLTFTARIFYKWKIAIATGFNWSKQIVCMCLHLVPIPAWRLHYTVWQIKQCSSQTSVTNLDNLDNSQHWTTCHQGRFRVWQ